MANGVVLTHWGRAAMTTRAIFQKGAGLVAALAFRHLLAGGR